MDPTTSLPALLLKIRRKDILTSFYEPGGTLGCGFFRINQRFLAEQSPVKRLEEGRCAVAISTYDVFARKTVTWSTGFTHEVVAASCAMCVSPALCCPPVCP